MLEFGCSNNIPEESYYKIEYAIMSHTSEYIEKLWLHKMNLHSSIFILNLLKTITTLKVLHLNSNQINQEAGQALASIILHNTGLEELHFSNSNLGEGMLEVAKSLQHITGLRLLNLCNNNISESFSGELALAIKVNEHLEQLQLWSSNLKSSTVVILESLNTISTLKVLNISDIQITKEASEALATAILHNKGLEELHLSNSNLVEGALQVVNALQQITSLKVLDLDNCNLPKEICEELAHVIDCNKSLEQLLLPNNNLCSSTVLILQALSRNSTLRFINLQGNQLTAEAGKHLASIVLHNLRLKKLYFNEGNFKILDFSSHRMLEFGCSNIIPEESYYKIEFTITSHTSEYIEKLWLYKVNLHSSIFILNLLKTITTLKVLHINNIQINQEAGQALASIILHNTGLEELHFSNSNLGEGMLEVAKSLQHITGLQSLNLYNNNISESFSGELALAIKVNEHLEQLRLYNNNLKSSAIVILKSLNTISTLKVLNISDIQITKEASEGLATAILHNKGLEELYLSNSNLGEGALQVVNALQQITSLKVLDLGNCNLPKEICEELAHVIDCNKYLEKLLLPNNNLCSSTVLILQALSRNSTLRFINLQGNQLTAEAGKHLASIVLHNLRLKTLYFNEGNFKILNFSSHRMLEFGCSNNIPEESYYKIEFTITSHTSEYIEKLWLYKVNLHSSIFILNLLKTITTLKVLHINNIQINQEANKALASIILHNTGLEELHFSNSNLGEGMLEVAKSLQHITGLRLLNLCNNNISESFSGELALAIKVNEHLEQLQLWSSNLKSSAVVILESLNTISTLKVLNISDIQITKEASEALATAILHNKGLEELHLSNSNLGEGALQVVNALQQITSLKVLDLDNCNLPKEICGELTHAIDCNKSLEQLLLPNNNLCSSTVLILQALSRNSTLRVINLQGNQLTAEAGKHLASIVLHNIRLEKLYFSEGNFINFLNFSSRRMLEFGCSNNIPEENYFKIEFAFTSCTSKYIEELWLHRINLHSSIFIFNLLKTVTTLKVLHLNSNQIHQEAGQALASIILHNTGLKELDFSNSNLGEGMLVIIKALQQITSLRSIELENINISKEVSGKLALAIQSNTSLEQLWLHDNNLRSSLVNILQALQCNSKLKLLNVFSNPITEVAGNILANIISKNIKLQELQLSLLTASKKVIEALQNLSALQSLVFNTCNISEENEIKIASTITNNKSLTWLSLQNVNMSENVICQSMKTISNLETLWLEDNSLSEEISDDLSLAISSNKSLEELILLGNMLQTGLIKIAKACNKLSNIKVLQLAHNCIVPSKVVELTSVITQNTSLERVLLGGITLNAAECFHLNINEVLCKTDITSDTSCVISNHCTYLEVIYLEMLRKQIDIQKKCLSNVPIKRNAKNFSFVHKLQHYFNQSDITQQKTHDAKQKLLQVDAKKMISSLYILEKVKVIDLENNNIDEDTSRELAAALRSNNVLEQLWLRGNKLNTAGALYILNSLEYLTTLQVLDLSYNNISSQSADGIAAVIDNNPLLNQLWLDGNDLHSTGTIKICKALKKIRTLSILSLCNNGITDDAAVELSAVITQNVLLEDLLLSNNQLHSTGIKLIAESLNKLIKLRKLDLFNNDIGKEGASSLAVVMQNSTSLQDLFLSSNNLETSGALEVCNALSHICSLHVLTLSNNNISEKITGKLIEVLNNNHLYALLIGGNCLECGGLKIAQVIENDNIAMQLLDLSDNNISEQDKEKIKVVFSKRANFQLYV